MRYPFFATLPLVLLAAAPSAALAADDGPASAPTPACGPDMETKVSGHRELRGPEAGRASTSVTRREIDERLPRSAPDALRYEPGVYVQQTAHGQGSAYIRGRTGQQTVLLFDGIRLNNSTFRQGPNQYFFTIDARTIRSIEVLRGGASTLHGSDAIAGALDARPLDPRRDPLANGVLLHPGLMFRHASADGEVGGRLQLDAQLARPLAVLAGVGYRRVGQLISGGRLDTPARGNTPVGGWVPRFEEDGRTQRGTGFHEIASDVRAVYRPRRDLELVAALYDYRQLDAPRTDTCPPPEAPIDTCLTYEEQFRTLAYLSLSADLGRFARRARVALSYQNQHERRLGERPASFVQNGGRDDVYTAGLLARFETAPLAPPRWRRLRAALRYGGDLYHDRISSAGWTTFTDRQQVIALSRGQYVDGSHYTWGGLYAQPQVTLFERLTLRGGARLAAAFANAHAEAASDTQPIDRRWLTAVGHAGLELRATRWLSLLGNLDRSYRAPNLDDLTSRQDTGPGFQIENPDLRPETSLTAELGLRLALPWLQADVWGYWARLYDAIEREPLPLAACPQATGRSCLRLVNLAGVATVVGVEGIARVSLPGRLTLRGTIAWARGQGPNPTDASLAPVPLSRIPPLNGTAELRWRHRGGVYAGAALRWALAQERLSLGDEADARIPPGGTPGFGALDLRAGYRLQRRLLISLVLENVTDAAYRYHGSSVNGPGRGLIISLEGNY